MDFRPFNRLQHPQESDKTPSQLHMRKYIPNGDIRWSNFWRNAHLECEKRRKRDSNANGSKILFKCSCLLERNTRHGSATCKTNMTDDYYLSCWISSLDCHPYSVCICTKDDPTISLYFLPGELGAVFRAISLVTKCSEAAVGNCQCHLSNVVDVPVRRGRYFLNFSRTIENGIETGFHLKQVNRMKTKQSQAIFVPSSSVDAFRYMLMQTEDTLQLQYEVLAQRYATFEIVARKMKDIPNYSKEDYYLTTMNTFFGLQVKEEDRLPVYFVLRDFIEKYLCEFYALYFNHTCRCVHCKSVIRDK